MVVADEPDSRETPILVDDNGNPILDTDGTFLRVPKRGMPQQWEKIKDVVEKSKRDFHARPFN